MLGGGRVRVQENRCNHLDPIKAYDCQRSYAFLFLYEGSELFI
ncbi:hypothetical protein [Stenotrophomonas phage BUCTxx99]|nr:hypothetical protein [Stenotrophomonas phage BUCTxx99]